MSDKNGSSKSIPNTMNAFIYLKADKLRYPSESRYARFISGYKHVRVSSVLLVFESMVGLRLVAGDKSEINSLDASLAFILQAISVQVIENLNRHLLWEKVSNGGVCPCIECSLESEGVTHAILTQVRVDDIILALVGMCRGGPFERRRQYRLQRYSLRYVRKLDHAVSIAQNFCMFQELLGLCVEKAETHSFDSGLVFVLEAICVDICFEKMRSKRNISCLTEKVMKLRKEPRKGIN